MSFKKYDSSTWHPITPKKLKGVPYTGTLPATLTGTKAGYLHRYKIYGNTEQTGTPTPENPIEPSECGEKTENLFDIRNVVNTNTAYYIEDTIYITAGVLWYDILCFTSGASATPVVARMIPVKAGTYTIKIGKVEKTYGSSKPVGFVLFTQDGSSIINITSAYTLNESNKTFTLESDGYISLRVSEGKPTIQGLMIVKRSTAPTSYIPYGYKLPLTSGNTPVDIYIGDDTLSAEEYIDSGTGKIYHMVDGVLTPVDPPVPFPQIPTSAGSTAISWAGEGLAPSQFDSIQEWVDIPTYTRVNGEWVADN